MNGSALAASHCPAERAELTAPHAQPGYEIRFESLFHSGRGLSFPCDAQGQVALHRLTERARHNYERAFAQIGIEYATPAVRLADLH